MVTAKTSSCRTKTGAATNNSCDSIAVPARPTCSAGVGCRTTSSSSIFSRLPERELRTATGTGVPFADAVFRAPGRFNTNCLAYEAGAEALPPWEETSPRPAMSPEPPAGEQASKESRMTFAGRSPRLCLLSVCARVGWRRVFRKWDWVCFATFLSFFEWEPFSCVSRRFFGNLPCYFQKPPSLPPG